MVITSAPAGAPDALRAHKESEIIVDLTMGQIFISEMMGTGILILLGCGVVANQLLNKTKGNSTGFLFVNAGWAFAVMAGVYFAQPSGGHINPAVTIGLAVRDLAAGTAVDWGKVFMYILGQMVGAMLGALLCWLTYKQHYDTDTDPSLKLGTFSTAPEIRNPLWNMVTETIATFVLVGWVVIASMTEQGKVFIPIGVSLLVFGIGMSLGGPTGYAINPARDLGPRIVHALIPMKGGKRDSDWGYSWIPVAGPILGGILAGLIVPLIYSAWL